MEVYLSIIGKTLFLYILILIIFRFMGKREIGELSILDLVVFIMIADLAIMAIDKAETPMFLSILPMIVLMVIQIVFSFISLKSKKFRDLVDGQPAIIIKHGKIDEKVMRQQRYNLDDLLVQLREKDVRNIADVEFAILETSGNLSVFKKRNNDEGDISLPLIIDGAVQLNNLKVIGKTPLWLRQQLRKKGFKEIKEISFCSYQNGQFYIDIIDE
ncbi:DUF421 domain-containing protein [Bacillaceae bacterium Marseille-Q3522]|nr:DUF421 domain-containing protein [Bacillaceae bacterium Marseille-Q3522]